MCGMIARVILALMAAALPIQAAELNGFDIMKRNYFVGKLRTVRNQATITLINNRGETRKREIRMAGKLQANGIDSNLILRFDYPPDIKGTGFLQQEHSDGDDNVWIYLPSLQKTRRLMANNKKDSFFGSDFANCDIMPPKVDLYHHKLLRSDPVDGSDCYVIESIPKSEREKTDTGYSKKITWVRKDNFVETKTTYYDLTGALLKTQLSKKHTLVDRENKRWVALYKEMINHQTGHKTIFNGEVKVGMAIPDAFFTTKTLEHEWR